MVKAYLRYELSSSFGVVSSEANIAFDASGKNVFASALENITLWNLRQSTAVKSFTGPRGENDAACPEVTCLAFFAPSTLAAGYHDGSIRLWDVEKGTCDVTFQGHKGAITALRFDATGEHLASGARDTDVIVWDVTGETGLFRLRGHRGQVTDLAFLPGMKMLVTGSKDQLVKVWDLESQHCCQTIVGHRAEVWALDVNPSGTRLVTGSTDAELRVFAIHPRPEAGAAAAPVLTAMGSLRRQGVERVGQLRFDPSGEFLCCMSAGKVVELFKVRSEAEAAKHLKRRKKRRTEKERKKATAATAAASVGAAAEPAAEDAADLEMGLTGSDEMAPHVALRLKHKAKSFAFGLGGKSKAARKAGASAADAPAASAVPQLAIALATNAIEVYAVSGEEGATPSLAGDIELPGHRSDVRSLALSQDDTLLLSTSSSGCKIWNPRTGVCLRTIEEGGYGLSSAFVPGGRHAVIGTKEGKLEIVDVAAGLLLASIDAHSGAIWSVCPLPDQSGIVTGSADHDVKFWEYEIQEDGERRTLGLRLVRTLKMSEDVLAVACSPDGKLVALSLLDSTIKVFFLDSLKFFLSLYGHKLPALSIDISSDGTLLVSGGADKNLRIWGLDFGDCHKSMFAHQDSIMQVRFVRNTHYAFTVGKDKSLKYWDCDRFEQLLTLDGHHAEVWCLAVSHLGDYVVTGSHDRSLRRWERTDEPFFVEEEKEKRLEAMFEEGVAREAAPDSGQDGKDGKEGEAGAVAPAGKRSMDAVTAAENLGDALELAAVEQARLDAEAARPSTSSFAHNPLLLGLEPATFVWKTIGSISPSDLEQTLMVLPFSDALRIVKYLPAWLEKADRVETSVRVATLLVRIHQLQLSSTPDARVPLLKLQRVLRPAVQRLKDVMGFNLAAMRMVQRVAVSARAGGAAAAAGLQALADAGGEPSLKRKLLEARIESKLKAGGAEDSE